MSSSDEDNNRTLKIIIAVLVLITAWYFIVYKNRTITAICSDGSKSYSQNASGTCSDHGGVDQWVNYPGDSNDNQSQECTPDFNGDC